MPEAPNREVTPLVGRGDALARTDSVLDQTETGSGQLLTLVGPAGVGKSRLVAEAVRRAHLRGFQVLQGTASPHQQDLSYAPLVEALRPLARDGQQLANRHLLEGLADLCRLFPDLPIGPPDPLVDAGLERTRLSEAVWRLLTRAARQRPLLVVIEDLHCADGGTISTLGYLARGLVGFPLLLLVASRPEHDSNTEAAQFLRNTPASTQLSVRPLDAPDIAVLVEQQLGGPVSGELVCLIEKRTRGVPLFVLGLLAMLMDAGRISRVGSTWVPLPGADTGVPAGAAEFFAALLSALTVAERSLIQAIAVCADAATMDVLEQVSSVPDPAPFLTDLRIRGVILEHAADTDVFYTTSHPLLAEVAYAQLSEPTRRGMHAKAARLVQETWPTDIGRLAGHVSRAGSEILPEEALTVLATATSVALQRLAGMEAMRHAEAAVALAQSCGRDDMVGRLYEQLGEAAKLAGRPERSVDSLLAAADRAASPLEEARLLRAAGTVAWPLGRFRAARSHLDRAASILADIDDANGMGVDRNTDTTELVDEKILLAEQRLYFAGRETRRADVYDLLDELRRLAEVHPAQPFNRARVLSAVVPPDWGEKGWVEPYKMAYDGDVVDMVEKLGDPILLWHYQRPWIFSSLFSGDIAAARRRVPIARKHAQSMGSAAHEVAPVALGGWAEFFGGGWDRALEMADEADAIAYRAGIPRERGYPLALRALILLRRGQIREARRQLAEARALLGSQDRHFIGPLEAVDAFLCVSTGNVSRAVELASEMGFVRSGGLPLFAQQARFEAFLAAEDVLRAAGVVDILRPGSDVFPLVGAQVARFEGLLAGAEGDSGAAVEKLSAACAVLTRLGYQFDAAQAELELCEWTADPALAEHALMVFDRLAARPFAIRAGKVLRRLGQPTPVRSRRIDGALSDREREVAQLVAEGLSNSAIAKRLVLSPRTVTTHLEHIYRRLGVNTRAALTRCVLEKQLPTK